MATPLLRPARLADAEQIALLHAESWRRHYRGAYSDSYLDGDLEADRRAVWNARLRSPANTFTIKAVDGDDDVVGFIHVAVDDDDNWGSLVDNLHVAVDRHRTGIGTALLVAAAETIVERAARPAAYLWVQELNTSAQAFYLASGGTIVETTKSRPPGDVPGRLNGSPNKLRVAWPDVTTIARGKG